MFYEKLKLYEQQQQNEQMFYEQQILCEQVYEHPFYEQQILYEPYGALKKTQQSPHHPQV
jgi:hypothetical protein